MRKGLQWLCLAMALVMALGVGSAVAEEKTYKVGILQFVEHPALDASVQGFRDALKDNGLEEGKNLVVDLQNPSADQATLQLMCEQLVAEGNDLLLGSATNAVQGLSAATDTIPILGTAVTDYVSAGLVASNEAPGLNVTGTTDMNPIDKQIELLKTLVPEAKTMGIIYTSSEQNSQIQADIAKTEAEKQGLEVIIKTISGVGELQQAAQALVGQVDVIYLPTDNVVASAVSVVADVCTPVKVPLIVGESNMCLGGGLATIGLDYYKLGYQTGLMAIRILKEGGNPAEMPIEALVDIDLTINATAAQMLGIEIPQEMLDSAVVIDQ